MLAGEFTHVVLLDGDMQHLPEEAARLLAVAAESAADVVLGERRFLNATMPASRYHANRLGSRVLSWFVACPFAIPSAASACSGSMRCGPLPPPRVRLRNRDRDAGEGPAARRARGERADHRRLRGRRSKLRPVRDTTRTCFLAVYYRFLERV